MTLRIRLTDEQRATLVSVRDGPTQPGQKDRAALLLLMGDGHQLGPACNRVGRSYNWGLYVVKAWAAEGVGAVTVSTDTRYRLRSEKARQAGAGRLELVAERRRRGDTYEAIGRDLGLTKERVRQLAVQAERQGLDLDPPPGHHVYSLQRAAQELGVSPCTAHKQCVALGIVDGRSRSHRRYAITDPQLEALRHSLDGRWRCQVCGVRLQGPSGRRGQPGAMSVCPDHRYEATMMARRRLLGNPPGEGYIYKHKTTGLAYAALKDVPPDPHAGFMRWTEVRGALPTLSAMKLSWLGLRGILATTPDSAGPPHKVTGRPVRLYYRNQVEALARALAGGNGGS
jgi:hypothetical protein